MKKIILFLFIVFVLFGVIFLYNNLRMNSPQMKQNITSKSISPSQSSLDTPLVTVIAENLEVAWALAFLPDGSILVTERPGQVRLIDNNGKLHESPVLVLDDVKQPGEGGLHGIAIHPQFNTNKYVYLYYTYGQQGNQTLNRVIRVKYENGKFTDREIIIDRIPGAAFHDGGRIKFGPDGYLYVTTGDAQEPSLSQNRSSLAGKILRTDDEGKAAPDNPFGTHVYSYGHRNPQGIAWSDKNELWETEHGSTAQDEINRINPGNNYGWPTIEGDETRNGMVTPIKHSNDNTWAPSGAAFIGNTLYFGGLKGEALFAADINGKEIMITEYLKGQLGRIREVVKGPDNMLYITTSNKDGRGDVQEGDDKVIKINPQKL